jgi:hypothetical protein
LAGGTLGQGSCDFGSVVGVLYDDFRFAQEGLALRREVNASAVAVQQPQPQLGLETSNLLAERRLRDEQLLCGPGEVELRCDRDEVAEVA